MVVDKSGLVLGSAAQEAGMPTRTKPNGSDPLSPDDIRLMPAKRFRLAAVSTLDQHAQALATLSRDLQTTREFLADLSTSVDALRRQMTAAFAERSTVTETTSEV